MSLVSDDILMHYGIPRRSGRYPWGSGDDPYQRTRDFLGRVEELKKSGWTETPDNIMKEFGMTTTQYRDEKRVCKNERRMLDVARAESLKADGLGPTEIGKKMGINESTVRSLLDPDSKARMMAGHNTAEILKERIKEKGNIDVGRDAERQIGVSRNTLDEAIYLLQREGYELHSGRVEQATNKGNWTTMTAICPPGTPASDIFAFKNGEINIHSLVDYYSHDGGETFDKFVYPKSMDSKRMQVRYAEDGGIDKDGIVELRRGVKDLSLGDSHYAQVRILVDDTHYIKGMAVYSDGKDWPDGVDVMFNTNKSKDVPLKSVLKEIKNDPDNPFGSLIQPKGQSYYEDENGKKQLSLINKRSDEGEWEEWQNAVPSQFLSKQSLKMAEKQLNIAKADRQADYDEICSLENPTVKKYWLNKYADECDAAAVHLKAAALPGQKYHVIIPVNSLKDDEVYAPNYKDGERLALVRYPHGGTFEIPILTVNNKNKAARDLIGTDSIDAVGITKKNADRLSGADFDGDTVMCIPTHDRGGKVKITSTPPLKGLEGFDPKDKYKYDEKRVDDDGTEHYIKNGKEFRTLNKKRTQTEMGIISNLITDMTLLGADDDEKAAAVRHSMVVIDAEKHKLDYKQSEIDNNISALKKKYQTGGASTLISRAKGETTILKRQGSASVNLKYKKDGSPNPDYDPSKPEGSLIYKTARDLEYNVAKVDRRSKDTPNATIRVSKKGKSYVQFDDSDEWLAIDGKVALEEGTRVRASVKTKLRTQASTNMADTDDARTLISEADTAMERLYADYANSMKSMANKARIEVANTGRIATSKDAKTKYADEVKSLNDKLNDALLNAPKERQAQYRTAAEVAAKKAANPNMSKEEIKKASQQALTRNRNEVGSIARRDRSIKITDKEWEAIQSGAVSENTLTKILNNSDADVLRQRSMPKSTNTLSDAKIARIKAMSASYTLEQIADKFGVSTSTVSKYLKGVK